MGMSLNGARTGLAHIAVGLPLTRRDLQRARPARPAAETGTPTPGSAGQRPAATTVRTTRGTASVSGLCWPQASPEREGSGGGPRSRRGGASLPAAPRDEAQAGNQRSLPAEGRGARGWFSYGAVSCLPLSAGPSLSRKGTADFAHSPAVG